MAEIGAVVGAAASSNALYDHTGTTGAGVLLINITDADGDPGNGNMAQQVVAVDIDSDGFQPNGDLYIAFENPTFSSVTEVVSAFEII